MEILQQEAIEEYRIAFWSPIFVLLGIEFKVILKEDL